jgi:deoxyribonuclease-4
MKLYCGAHTGVNINNILDTIMSIESSGVNVCQILITEYMHKNVSSKLLNDTTQFKLIKKYLHNNDIKLFIHSSFMLNFARISIKHTSWWITNLINEMICASKMGAIGCIVHMGKHLELSKRIAIDNMYRSLLYVLENTPKNVKLILETPCGQGTELCYKLEDLRDFFEMFPDKDRIKFCIDTCHIFVAGYDIRTKRNVLRFFEKINNTIKLENVCVVHLNDSKNDLGSKIDRHEIIGKGYIGMNGLSEFVKICYSLGIPIILETPTNNHTNEINIIKKIIQANILTG